jgi:hypothetical protein
VEDDLLVEDVGNYSTSDILFHDWNEISSDLPGCLRQQCKGRYRFDDDVVELSFVFLCVTFRGSPVLRSTHVFTKDSGSVDSTRPTTAYVSPTSPVPSPSSPSSVTHVHRCIGYCNPHWKSLSKSVRLTYLSVYDSRDGGSEPSPFVVPLLTHGCTLSYFQTCGG